MAFCKLYFSIFSSDLLSPFKQHSFYEVIFKREMCLEFFIEVFGFLFRNFRIQSFCYERLFVCMYDERLSVFICQFVDFIQVVDVAFCIFVHEHFGSPFFYVSVGNICAVNYGRIGWYNLICFVFFSEQDTMTERSMKNNNFFIRKGRRLTTYQWDTAMPE